MPRKRTKEEFIKDAKKIHGDRYDYSKVEYNGIHNYVIIVCFTHGDFKQTPHAHLFGQGCSKCSGNYHRTDKEYIQLFKDIHGNKYDYSLVKNCKRHGQIILICPIHGEFKQLVSEHIQGSGCSKCAGCGYTKTSEEFIKDAKKVHGDRYDYSKVKYINNKIPVEIICFKHGLFRQRPDLHLHRSNGCPKCNQSKGEKFIEKFLVENNIEFKNNFIFNDCINPKTNYKLKFDFYLPQYNICIEYDGVQHFKKWAQFGRDKNSLKQIQYRDEVKNIYCKTKKIHLIRFNFKQNFTEIMNYLKGVLK